MFGKMGSDTLGEALGLSDIGKVIDSENYSKTEAPNYTLNEDGETIHFLIKSKSDEYCFTNFALIHLDGSGAISRKILLRRYPYRVNPISNIYMETAGWIDTDIEINFKINNKDFSIDVKKQDLNQVQGLYKALVKISEIQEQNQKLYEDASHSLKTASEVIQSIDKVEINPEEQFNLINQHAFAWMKSSRRVLMQKDFGQVFETFVKG
jgi:hypothetical protein